jgi:exopolyphosphatase/guanosine-5'-triphosphate,3'-diphosphate pyrophosphatase
MVRLNAGLDENGNLSAESQQRARDCLDRFSQRLRGIPPAQIRAVGTNTFRAAHNADEFLSLAEHSLNHHISIISGHEEARLVYLGAAFSLESSGQQRLVIDIGGGSTELIIGRGYKAFTMNSLYMGCVSFSRRFFSDGKITDAALEAARAAALLELEPITAQYQELGWQEVVGTSGTIRAVDELSRALGLNQDWLSDQSFEYVDRWLIEQGHGDKLELVSDQRRPVFAAGYAILSAIFKALNLTRLDHAAGALREGVLYDLNGRLHDQDSRDLGVETIVNRLGCDRKQSDRIEATCYMLFDQVEQQWQFDQVVYRKLLGWACRLHEAGIAIAFSQYHKHGSYIIQNSDIDGFSRQQQRLLALLIRSHRQKFPLDLYLELAPPVRHRVFHLAVLLRLGFALNRGRVDTPLPNIVLAPFDRGLGIKIDRDWCINHPLTILDLEAERGFLAQANFTLELSV